MAPRGQDTSGIGSPRFTFTFPPNLELSNTLLKVTCSPPKKKKKTKKKKKRKPSRQSSKLPPPCSSLFNSSPCPTSIALGLPSQHPKPPGPPNPTDRSVFGPHLQLRAKPSQAGSGRKSKRSATRRLVVYRGVGFDTSTKGSRAPRLARGGRRVAMGNSEYASVPRMGNRHAVRKKEVWTS